jgi:hypothetical protein
MEVWMIVALALVAVWALAHMKTSRPDGTIIKRLHPYRKLMPYVMRGRNESVVFFDTYVNAEPLLEYLDQAKQKFDVNMSHCLVGAGFVGLVENPTMNQFSHGQRLYERDGRWISFSMKRKRKDKKAKLSVVKKRLNEGETFRQLCERINDGINVERSGKKTAADKEFDIFKVLPRPAMNGMVHFVNLLDYFNLLPGWFIEGDGMYTSIFIANLGSVGMAPGYHHLYEWGNCPLFMMVGKVEERPVVRNGEIVVQKTMHIRWSYDERIDDGLSARFGIDSVKRALEHPFEYLGCLADDGSDARPLSTPGEPPTGEEGD